MSDTAKKVLSAILVAVVIAALIGLIIFIAKITNNFTDEAKTFYVSRDGVIYATVDEATQVQGEKLNYNVTYTFGGSNARKGYSVKVVPNATTQTDFTYTVNGESHRFVTEDLDFSKAFKVELNTDYFSLTMPYGMKEALQTVYPDGEITVPEEVDITKQHYFKLIVTSYNAKSQTELYLKAETFKLSDDKNFN